MCRSRTVSLGRDQHSHHLSEEEQIRWLRRLGTAPCEGGGGRECQAHMDGRCAVTGSCCAPGRDLPKTRRLAQKREVVHGFVDPCAWTSTALVVSLPRFAWAAWCTAPQEWTVRDAALIAALSKLVDRHSSWGACCTWLRTQHPPWNTQADRSAGPGDATAAQPRCQGPSTQARRIALTVPQCPNRLVSGLCVRCLGLGAGAFAPFTYLMT